LGATIVIVAHRDIETDRSVGLGRDVEIAPRHEYLDRVAGDRECGGGQDAGRSTIALCKAPVSRDDDVAIIGSNI